MGRSLSGSGVDAVVTGITARAGASATDDDIKQESSPPPISSVTPQRLATHLQGTVTEIPTAQPSAGESLEVGRRLDLIRSSHLDARERVAAGNALAQQGDPRFRADAWFLPNEPLLGFVEIPTGPF